MEFTWAVYAGYVLVNVITVSVLYRYLNNRVDNKLLVWLFSLSLSLGITFLVVLLILGLVVNYRLRY